MTTTRYESKKPSYQTRLSHDSQPPLDSTAVFAWERFSPLTDFSASSLTPVFNRISRDIIERPYHYDAHKVFDAHGKIMDCHFSHAENRHPPAKIAGAVVYKQNHGTGHAIRQMIYTDALIDKIIQEGTSKGQAIAQKINSNPEIKSILKIAAYCKRIGRTLDHEQDDPGHTTIYSKRSADMFALIATELGYNSDLILAISESMLEPMPKKPSTLSAQTIGGINGLDLRDFSHNVVMAAHMADLARLFEVRRKYIQTALKNYFKPTKLSQLSTELVEMACIANMMTGNPVVQQEAGVKHQITALNGEKLVAVVHDIKGTIDSLSTLKFKALSINSIAPSTSHPVAQASTKPLAIQEQTLRQLLAELDLKARELTGKAKIKPKEYTQIAKEIRQLHTTLTNKMNYFKLPTVADFAQFRSDSINAIDAVNNTAKEHRGWHKVHPILRAIVGVLAALAIIPARQVMLESKHGFMQTFFATPETDTLQKINTLKRKFQEQADEMNDVINMESAKRPKNN